MIAQDIELWLLEEEAKKTGVPVGYGTRVALDVWGDMSELEMNRVEARMAQVVRHLAMAWAVPGIEDGSVRTPKILWRASALPLSLPTDTRLGTLHHVKSHRKVPFTRVQALDQIGRRVVERLQEQGRKANLGELEYARWMERMRAEGTAGGLEQPWAQVRAMGLGERLGLNDWGAVRSLPRLPAIVRLTIHHSSCSGKRSISSTTSIPKLTLGSYPVAPLPY